jgi:hypothetical protein
LTSVFQRLNVRMPPPTTPPVKKYTRRADSTGCLSVRLTATNQLAALCEFTQVNITAERGGRTYFKIMDGTISVGQEASLTSANAALYLNPTGPAGAAAITVTYVGEPVKAVSTFKGELLQQWADLSFNGQTARVTLNSVWGDAYSPIVPGTHAILAPDYSHANISTAGHASATPGCAGNDVWFPIGLRGSGQNSSRYINIGHLSEGCVTVYELSEWLALYTYLISHRKPESAGRMIGSMLVIKPARARP